MAQGTDSSTVTDVRRAELRRNLEARRREILAAVQERMLSVRSGGASAEGLGVLDAAETAEADIQAEIELALIQMRTETLHMIEEALSRLDGKTYGCCNECGEQISEQRLRALPFAVRCKDCEEAREGASLRQRHLLQGRPAGFPIDLS
jgi:DnaK suppressor protein